MKRLLIIIMLVLASAQAGAESRRVLVRIEQQPSPYGDGRLYERLALALTRQNGFEVAPAMTTDPLQAPFPQDVLDVAAIADWGRSHEAQFILLVLVHGERLEHRKGFHVPLVFHKYEAVGVIEGELRIIDVAKAKLVKASPFKVEQIGPRILQATMDDDINDPDIHLTAPQKVRFFGALEDKLVEWILTESRGPLGRYDREYVSRPQGKN